MENKVEHYKTFDFNTYSEEQKYEILKRAHEQHAAAHGKHGVKGFCFETDPGKVNLVGARGLMAGKIVKDSNTLFDDTLFVVYVDAAGAKKVVDFAFNTEPHSSSGGGLAGRVLVNGLYQYRLANHKVSSYHQHAKLSDMEHQHHFAQHRNYRALKIIKGMAFHPGADATGVSYDYSQENPDQQSVTIEHNIHYGGEGNKNKTSNWSEGCQTVKGLDNYIKLLKVLEKDYSLMGTINNELVAKPSVDGKRYVVYALLDGTRVAEETRVRTKFLDGIWQPIANAWYEITNGNKTITGKTDAHGDTKPVYGHNPSTPVKVTLKGPVGDAKKLAPIKLDSTVFSKYLCVISPKILCDAMTRPDADHQEPVDVSHTKVGAHKHHNKKKKPVVKVEVPKNRNPIEAPIPDDEFENCDALTQEQIATIMRAHNSVLVDTYQADALVYTAAQNFKLNPKVLLATMQQEQGWAKNGRYNKLMGVGPGGSPTSLGVEKSINISAKTYRKFFNKAKDKITTLKINHDPDQSESNPVANAAPLDAADKLMMQNGYDYTPRTASEFSKLTYTPWTYFPPQKSRPYDSWVKAFRSF